VSEMLRTDRSCGVLGRESFSGLFVRDNFRSLPVSYFDGEGTMARLSSLESVEK